MTREEINERIDLLGAEIRMNEEENYSMESEIEELENQLEAMDEAEE